MEQMNQQQVDEMKEKLSNMSPEELKEYQKERCIFCQIISGKVASKKIYSDDKCTAILDINPANPGHILLIPNEHYSIMPLIPADELKHLFLVAKALAQASLKALEAQGTNIFVANGLAAGQKAQHFMIHVIPRKEGDTLKLDIPENTINDSDMKQVIPRIRKAIEKTLGKMASTPEEPTQEKIEIEKSVQEEVKTEGHKTEEVEEIEETEEIIEEPEEEHPKKTGDFITSAKARRFHSNTCPFAQNIKEDSRIYLSQEEAEIQGKLPCTCTGLKKKEGTTKKKVKKKTTTKTTKKKPEQKPKTDEPATLDDISSLLTGRM